MTRQCGAPERAARACYWSLPIDVKTIAASAEGSCLVELVGDFLFFTVLMMTPSTGPGTNKSFP